MAKEPGVARVSRRVTPMGAESGASDWVAVGRQARPDRATLPARGRAGAATCWWPGVIQAEAETLRLNADLIAFDTDLVGGEFMEGLAVPDAPLFEDWLSSERLSWRHRSVDALGKLASEAFATGDLATAAKAGQRSLALAPTSDRAVRVAMRAAALAADRKGALARYERFEHRRRVGRPDLRRDDRACYRRLNRPRRIGVGRVGVAALARVRPGSLLLHSRDRTPCHRPRLDPGRPGVGDASSAPRECRTVASEWRSDPA